MKVEEVIVYVEGPSDKLSMEALLEPLIQQKQQEGIIIKFFPAPEGHNKESVIAKVPRRATSIIRNKPNSVVVAMPDLYPRDIGFDHETFNELKEGIFSEFDKALRDIGIENNIHLHNRFKVFCFKYDLEVLVLASEEALKMQLGVDQLDVKWKTPVEDQDHDDPPKRVVERLFEERGESYEATEHAPAILGASDYRDIADRCPQCFKPFVDFLTNLQPVSYSDISN